MTETAPRFEFRAFAKNFGIVEERMRAQSPCEQIRESDEIYIVSAANDKNNTKIRGGKMDIKALIAQTRGLEQWKPRMKGSFPMSRALIKEAVFPAFGVNTPPLTQDAYPLDQFISRIVQPHPHLVAVRVFKRRYGFTINGCISELAEIWINGGGIQTAAVESTDADAVLTTIRSLALDAYENVNYLRAIKRVVGLEPFSAT